MAEKRDPAHSERLNAGCFCISLDNALLHQALSTELGSEEIVRLVEERCPFLFSARPVFISEAQATRRANVITAIEAVVRLPAYQIHVLATAPDIAQHDPDGAQGVFFGYDFHLSVDAIGLIEINTNAGGAMLNAGMARAYHACCLNQEELAAAAVSADEFETRIVEMFRQEWYKTVSSADAGSHPARAGIQKYAALSLQRLGKIGVTPPATSNGRRNRSRLSARCPHRRSAPLQ